MLLHLARLEHGVSNFHAAPLNVQLGTKACRHHCTLELLDERRQPTGIAWVEVVQRPCGQLVLHLSAADVADCHIENHTNMQSQK